uniref:Mitochondrial pyruvate carrier n=1 Tax=Bionectria ochroleuca TaxID=29856 RepID=A0A8H7NIT8_BIOOC
MASTTNTVMRAARPLFRQQAPFFTRNAALRQRISAPRFGQGRRWQSTAEAAQEQQSWFKKMWESEIGFKTVHFWAPIMKWAIVIAGIADFARPAEKLSFTQNFALTCTGLIWTRWCLIIKPRNVLLATVNFFLAIVGIVQVTRIALHNSSSKDGAAAVAEEVKSEVKEGVEAAKDAVKA